MGSNISKIEDAVYDFYRRNYPDVWFLAPPFLASVGAIGFVGYSFANNKAVPSSPNVSFSHLLGVAGGFGISFWMNTVHGTAMFRLLTRQDFGTVQSHISSVYFSSTAVLASLSLGTFLLRHPYNTWSKDAANLGIALTVALICAEVNSIVLSPLVTNLMFDRNNIEFIQSAKSSDEIEKLHAEDPKYRIISNKFSLFHSLSLATGLVYHGLQWYHLWFLADKCLVL
ncbi:unnamed protein product [Didymodactylos carnosus]|uniref:TMEM205-like domain-containing protein n=1 Tax=Didymodactylos carnosus TaxID=1234261 RepID=A0A8S2HYE8_9BILA|nr:unnamed protein product [Didymodactylos carnosus]CAF3697058.1 unnamed protein product [Didymodactylos carnosus]